MFNVSSEHLCIACSLLLHGLLVYYYIGFYTSHEMVKSAFLHYIKYARIRVLTDPYSPV